MVIKLMLLLINSFAVSNMSFYLNLLSSSIFKEIYFNVYEPQKINVAGDKVASLRLSFLLPLLLDEFMLHLLSFLFLKSINVVVICGMRTLNKMSHS